MCRDRSKRSPKFSIFGSRNSLVPEVAGSGARRGHTGPHRAEPKVPPTPPGFLALGTTPRGIPAGNGPEQSRKSPGILRNVPGALRELLQELLHQPVPTLQLFYISRSHNSRGSDVIWDIAATSSLLSAQPRQHPSQKFLLQSRPCHLEVLEVNY